MSVGSNQGKDSEFPVHRGVVLKETFIPTVIVHLSNIQSGTKELSQASM